MRLLAEAKVLTVVVAHRDRLMRFGFEYVEAALAAQGRLVVQDMIEVLTSFCVRLHGCWWARNKDKKALEAIQREG